LAAGAALAALAAHRRFAPSAIAFLAAALILRFFAAGFADEAFAAVRAGAGAFFGAAFAARIAAHLRFAASAMARRPAALILRFFAAGLAGGAARLVVRVAAGAAWRACKASIARDRRSRSAISKETICSVCI